MPGLIVRVNVSVGDRVEAGQGIVVMEAMKMENELRATAAGTVKSIEVAAGTAVEKGGAEKRGGGGRAGGGLKVLNSWGEKKRGKGGRTGVKNRGGGVFFWRPRPLFLFCKLVRGAHSPPTPLTTMLSARTPLCHASPVWCGLCPSTESYIPTQTPSTVRGIAMSPAGR